MKKILLISGKSGSGKDTFGHFLKDQLLNERVLFIHFGDPVKWLASTYYNWDGQKDVEGRNLLQRLGTNQVKTMFPTYWADIISKFIASTANDWDYVIIPDWRFEDEYETICKYNDINNVITIRINRTQEGKPYYNPEMRIHQLTHISECALDNYNFEWIIEHETLKQLEESAEKMREYLND